MASARSVGPVPADAVINATLVLRRRGDAPDPTAGEVLSRAEMAARYGADPADIGAVRAALAGAGCTVMAVDAGSRQIRISAPAGVMNSLFGTTLEQVTLPQEAGAAQFQHRTGELSVPAELGGIVTAVLGLDTRPQGRPHFRTAIAAAAAHATSFTPPQLGAVYRMPDGTDGSGQVLAIIELGGGFRRKDLKTYFAGLGITMPKVQARGVDGSRNRPGTDATGADGEVMLDIEVAGALAPGATMKVYFAPNTDAGFLDAVVQASKESPTPTAMSISWGQSEDGWTQQARTAMDQAFADAAMLGITVTAAAGDDGSADRVSDGAAHVDFPAASPHVLACGGTSLTVGSNGAVTSETVWNDGSSGGATGGGISDAFALPGWQSGVGVPARAGGGTGRGVPDVAGDADPQTGYQVLVDGKRMVYGGTSAVAPLWAALVCRLVQSLGRPLGLLQAAIYGGVIAGSVPPGFRDIVSGNNGAYSAGPGWDACTGLGVPVGSDLLTALAASAPKPKP